MFMNDWWLEVELMRTDGVIVLGLLQITGRKERLEAVFCIDQIPWTITFAKH